MLSIHNVFFFFFGSSFSPKKKFFFSLFISRLILCIYERRSGNFLFILWTHIKAHTKFNWMFIVFHSLVPLSFLWIFFFRWISSFYFSLFRGAAEWNEYVCACVCVSLCQKRALKIVYILNVIRGLYKLFSVFGLISMFDGVFFFFFSLLLLSLLFSGINYTINTKRAKHHPYAHLCGWRIMNDSSNRKTQKEKKQKKYRNL